MSYFMGIDLGTSSVKTLVMDETGNIISMAQKGYDIIKPYVEYAEQDIELLWEAAKATIKECLSKQTGISDQIQGIGLSGQMHGLVMLDSENKPVRNAIIWADQRSKSAIDEIYRLVPPEEYKSIALNSLSTGFFVSSLMWVKMNEPENYKKIHKAFLPKDYLRYKLCGELATDKSDASSAVIFDVKNRDWPWELIDRLGFDRSIFVDCHESYEIAGEVTEECERELGLKKGTRIVYGGGDSLMQAVGNAMITPGVLVANIGTASQVSCSINNPLFDREYRTNTFCHVKEDLWTIMGANLSGGVALKWLKNNILGISEYDQMTDLAETVPAGSEDLLFLPYLNGERTPYNDPNAKAIFLGLTLKHSKAHMIRSAMEGVVFALKNSIEIFNDLGIKFEKIIASGGGARDRLFLQIQADMFDKEIYTNVGNEQACIGAAITAAVGVGAYSSYEEACENVVKFNTHVVKPIRENVKVYEERFEKYRQIYLKNRDLF